MSETVSNQSRFRIYAIMWLDGSVFAVAAAFVQVDPPTVVAAIYVALAGVFWAANMVVNGSRKGDPAAQVHRLAHALLTAAAALVWPLTLALVVAILAAGVVPELRREAGAS